MGSDDPKHRRSYAAPPSVLLGSIFAIGVLLGVVLTLLAASIVPDNDAHLEARPQFLRKETVRQVSAAPALLRPDFWIETISDLPGPRIFVVSFSVHARARTHIHIHVGALTHTCVHGWGERAHISEQPGVSSGFADQNVLVQLHNMLSKEECEHLKSLGVMTGMEKVCNIFSLQ
jgi:hypothetical protein